MNHQKLTSTRPSSFIARLCKTEVKGKENLTAYQKYKETMAVMASYYCKTKKNKI
jgi:hypothetical protein